MKSTANFRLRSSAFTLVESLVVVGLIATLLALLLPAVQQVREAARRTSCVNNLRQIGLALQNYHQLNNCFPIKSNSQRTSFLTSLLPHLDQLTLYNNLNFTTPELITSAFPVYRAAPSATTAASTSVGIFLCPSDTGNVGSSAGCSYRGNVGVGPAEVWSGESYDSDNGFFVYPGVTNSASFPDGLSQTVALSERLRGSGRAADGVASRDYYNLSLYPLSVYRDADTALGWCKVAVFKQKLNFSFVAAGQTWFKAGRDQTHYNHAQEPNGKIPDGLSSAILTPWGIATARSFHVGGVNVLMGDGSYKFVQGSIARVVWRGLGTRNGGELVE